VILVENTVGSHNNCSWCSNNTSIDNVLNPFIANNIFYGTVSCNGGILRNNIFNNRSNYVNTLSVSYGTIENNLFYLSNTYAQNSIFRNNVGIGYNGSDVSGNQGVGNVWASEPFDSLFVNTANQDFHLRANSPYHNAGTDGTDIGIYGGAFPWKEGSIPFNPHFQQVQIAPKTDNQGNLNVNIRVKAQDR